MKTKTKMTFTLFTLKVDVNFNLQAAFCFSLSNVVVSVSCFGNVPLLLMLYLTS